MSDHHEAPAKTGHDAKHEPKPGADGHGDAKHGEGDAHGHDAHGGKSGASKAIGLTMGILGAMLALCAALVGSQRTQLIAARVEQSTRIGLYMSEATKFRVMDSDLELLHALTPSKTETDKFEGALKGVRSRSGKADDEDTAELKDLLDVSTRSTADVLTPDPEDEKHFASIRGTYKKDMGEAKEDAEAYDIVIEAHESGAEGFEMAQVMAEVGIVTAAISLLSGSRIVWMVAILIGLAGAGTMGKTYMKTSEACRIGEAKIAAAKASAAKMEEEDEDDGAKPGEKAQPSEKPAEKPAEKPKAE